MENFLFYYPEEQNRFKMIDQILHEKTNILALLSITEHTLLYCKHLVRHKKRVFEFIRNVKSDNYYVNLLYKHIYGARDKLDNLSIFFLQLCGEKPSVSFEDEVVFYLYTKNYKKVNRIICTMDSHLAYFYLFFCGSIRLKEKTVFHALKYIHPNLYIDAYRMLIDKSIVPMFVIIHCDAVTRLNFMLTIKKKPDEFRIRIIQRFQMMYIESKKAIYFRKCIECMKYMNLKDYKMVLFAWLDVFYVYDKPKFYELMYTHIILKVTDQAISKGGIDSLFVQLKNKLSKNEYSILNINKR